MTFETIEYIDSLDATEFDLKILVDSLREMVKRRPHPWFGDTRNRFDIISYNYDHLQKHMIKLENSSDDHIVYQEVLYHAGAIMQLCGGLFIGSKEEDPIRFFRIGKDYSKVSRNSENNRYFKDVVERAKKVITSLGIEWSCIDNLIDQLIIVKGSEPNPIVINSHGCIIGLGRIAMDIAERIAINPSVLELSNS